MRYTCLLLSLFLSGILTIQAEGTRELAPNGSIVINGNNTSDIAALFINSDLYNNFATYTNNDPFSRLYVHIADPSTECIYLGFSFAHINLTTPTPPRVNYEFRVKDPDGNIVFGPIAVTITGGNIVGWDDASAGPMQLFGPDGYEALHITSEDLMSEGWNGAGDYYVEFLNTSDGGEMLIDFWDITVADCSSTPGTELTGRVWSYNWAIFAINDFGFPNRPFNGSFFVCAPDPQNPDAAFITEIDFNGSGFRPAAFNIAFNSFGAMNTGNVMVDRRSVENLNATQPEYAVFLNDPIDICETAEGGDIELLGVTRCEADEYCIKFTASKPGQIDLLLDFDGPDDMYTPGSADVMLALSVTSGQVDVPTCVDWDGLDGLGNPVAQDPDAEIPILIAYAQGIYHFPIYDAELMLQGFRVRAIRPTGPEPLLFYDDSQITVPSGSGEPAIQLSGCMLPCHRWTNYTDNATPGFGNLHTINSWWFSQLVVRKEIYVLPALLSCAIEGTASICDGETGTLEFLPQVDPPESDMPQIIRTTWSGPSIVGGNQGSTIEFDEAGIYALEVVWVTALGDTCSTGCQFTVEELAGSSEVIDTLILYGDTININGEIITEGGQYEQLLVATNGCDSLLTINVLTINTVVHYDLNNCASNIFEGTGADYSEFGPSYPQPVSCANINAGIIHRENPNVNRHSCTPGVGGSPAMCVSSLDDCNYDPGNEKSIIFEVTIEPAPDTAVVVTSLAFFERAPEEFDWIDGDSGLNNYPTLYGVRVLKDGVEVFSQSDIDATTEWSEELFDFSGMEGFTIDSTTVFRFELLGYCLVGNGGLVAAWDIDEVTIMASCVAPPPQEGLISGSVISLFGRPLADVEVKLDVSNEFINPAFTWSGQDAVYAFPANPFGVDYFLKAFDNSDHRNGVSTLDLVLIQKHLLDEEPFANPLLYIAADANRSNTVTAIDLVEFRKLILGYYTELPANTSWRFGPASQDIPPGDPWVFTETLQIRDHHTDVLDADFTGIKIGDLNGTAKLNGESDEVVVRNPGSVEKLQYRDRFVKSGETAVIEFTFEKPVNISGMQWEMVFDGLTAEAIYSSVIDFEGSYRLHGGGVLMSYVAPGDRGKNHNAMSFNIRVRAERSGMISRMIRIDDRYLRPEVYVGDGPGIRSVELAPVAGDLVESPATDFRIAPNPMTETATIWFEVLQPGNIEFAFYDISGRAVLHLSGEYAAGSHTFDIGRRQLNDAGGVLICRMQGDGFVATRKLVLLD